MFHYILCGGLVLGVSWVWVFYEFLGGLDDFMAASWSVLLGCGLFSIGFIFDVALMMR